jgi:CDGSH-type Zn-finger protein
MAPDNCSITLKGKFLMSEAKIAQKGPYRMEVEAGKSYFWCACGQSANQPLCDGSHKGGDFKPVKFEATASETLFFCGCKHTASPVLCDGSHNKL